MSVVDNDCRRWRRRRWRCRDDLCRQATTSMAFVTAPLLDMARATMLTSSTVVADAIALFAPTVPSSCWSGDLR